ncbi:carboxylating nicotinate-nucleotide diphosphorylase [Pseudoxanthomonas sp. CAU 1598]|uniref:Probable nicotinate-nucleotide pyrophosphorylase [carboxylating] n=1 Tax=Pseudomarimonas arenosa TaxID=2774145 RepID=A0AAW3ZMV6_9GAMM|nr:carboxylating nicotinate-nucleotide diphosphorylase [Pseudomarimonas arenosa]
MSEHEFAAADPAAVAGNVAAALAEDLGSGDVSAALVPDHPARARIITREPMLLCGRPWAEACFRQLDPNSQLHWQADDGERLESGATLVEISGQARALLSGERSALNFLQLLSATASETARYVAALAGTPTRVLDTRKTLPGLRLAQKYAVRCGGGVNHRIGLFDAVMLKENHIAAAGSIAAAMERAKQQFPTLPLIVEVESMDELRQVIAAGGCTRVLIDEFSLSDMQAAVELCRPIGLPLEVSGGVSFDRLAEIGATGVDFVSIGSLTKHVRAIDLSMRFIAPVR